MKCQQHQNSTCKTYHSIWQKFNKFIVRLDRIPPTWESRLAIYCTYLICEQELQSSTIKTYISAIKDVLKTDGYQWNGDAVLLNVLTKSCKLKNDRLKTRLPIRKGLLEIVLCEVRRKFCNQIYLEAVYVTVILLAYYCMLRVGEICESHHSVKAINVHEGRTGSKMLLVLYSSKTHGKESPPQRITVTSTSELKVTEGKLTSITNKSTDKNSKSHQHFCPVLWLKHYIALRQKIRNVDEQLFVFKDGTPLQPNHLRKLLRKILFNRDLDPTLYDTHSFRIGRANYLFKMNTPIDTIKNLGRWRSNAVYNYLRHTCL